MKLATATAYVEETGPLTQVVNAYCACQARRLAAGIKSADDWAPVAEFVDVANFRRVGAYLEEFDWNEYLEFLTGWAGGGTRFEMTVFRITEAANVVIQEIEERHHRGDTFIRKNVVAIYEFDRNRKIRHLDIYEQASDSGQWIKEAASAACAA